MPLLLHKEYKCAMPYCALISLFQYLFSKEISQQYRVVLIRHISLSAVFQVVFKVSQMQIKIYLHLEASFLKDGLVCCSHPVSDESGKVRS